MEKLVLFCWALVFSGVIAQEDPCLGLDDRPVADGFYSIPGECISDFYYCTAGEFSSFNCGDDMVFDPSILKCVPEKEASCFNDNWEAFTDATGVTEDNTNESEPATTTTLASTTTQGATNATTEQTTSTTQPPTTQDTNTSGTTSSSESTTSTSTTTTEPTKPTPGPNEELDQLQTNLYITAGVLGGACLVIVGGIVVLVVQMRGVMSKMKKPAAGTAAAAAPGRISSDVSSRFNVYQPGRGLPRLKMN